MLIRTIARSLIALSAVVCLGWAHADTDISQTPLITNELRSKPNIMFVLDNSGSMAWDYTPDALNSTSNVTSLYGYRSIQCNGSAYDPNFTYTPPVTPDGRSYPNMPIGAAWTDGFRPALSNFTDINVDINTVLPSSGTTVSITLSTSLANGTRVAFRNRTNPSLWLSGTVTSSSGSTRNILLTFSSMHDGTKSDWRFGIVSGNNLGSAYYYNYKGSEPKMAWAYDSNGNLVTTNTFVSECLSVEGSSLGQSVFNSQPVSGLSASQQQNYANWYSYYRTRILNMRTAAGQAIATLDSNYRVGFSSLNAGGEYNSSITNALGRFADIRDFDDAQRVVFFSNLYGTAASGDTQLRRALAKAGQYYGNALSGQTDPVPPATLACQRNFTLLTTDGYWNDSTNPTRLDGTAIGNWDGDLSKAPRPMFDGTGDSVIIERRVSNSVKISNTGCGLFGLSPTYRHTIERRTVTRKAGVIVSATAWAVQGTTNTCNINPPAVSNTTVSSGGASNTLADVAKYYRSTPLSRPQTGPSEAGTPPLPIMTTYTLGFGLSGTLRYDPLYQSQTSGDYVDLVNGTKSWPAPSANSATTVDDLWHAAINGGGNYYAASDPAQLTQSLVNTFNDIESQVGAGASAASSSLRPVLGTDQIFVGSYRTKEWDGNIKAFTLKEGVTQFNENPDWEAREQLNGLDYTTRDIYYMGRTVSAGGVETKALTRFTFENLSADADATTLTDHFNGVCSKANPPSQCSTLSTAQRTAASGANLVNFLRGDRSNEGSLFRTRSYILGTIVDASPVYVGKPPFSYADAGYNAFKSDQNNRCSVVYAAANDGMLHAFSAHTEKKTSSTNQETTQNSDCKAGGTELWAYVPRAVMSQMYQLADKDYEANHRFFVNGTPVVGDISLSAAASGTGEPVWSTILVGGFGAGGRGYYALDITDPASPRSLWEFTDADMGLSYGNPIITKVPNSSGQPTWVVAFTSGLNNSGNGYLYILNAHTGQLMYKIPTLIDGAPVGTSAEPSGLNKLNAWIERPTDNTTLRFYGGDMLGHLWRFNAESASALAAPASSSADTRAFLVAKFVEGGEAQPITIRPELAKVEGQPVVIVGTGRYLGQSDPLDLDSVQSVYGIKDPLDSATGWGDIRANAGVLVEQTLTLVPGNTSTGTADQRTVTSNQVDWGQSGLAGWYIDLPDAGERVVVPMSLAFDTLTLATLVPESSPCAGSGFSWLFDLNIRTGSFVSERAGDQVAATKYNQAVMGISTLQVDGETKTRQTITKSDGTVSLRDHVTAPSSQGGLRRTSWREIVPTPQ